jgi:hypothetical protein
MHDFDKWSKKYMKHGRRPGPSFGVPIIRIPDLPRHRAQASPDVLHGRRFV